MNLTGLKKITKKEKINKYIFYIIIFLLSSLSLLKTNTNFDEGVIISGAWHLYNGFNLYSDIFSYIAPGSFYLVYFLWKIFGASYLSIKILSIFVLAFSGIGIYKSINLIRKSFFSFLFPLFYISFILFLPVVNHNFLSIFFLIYTTYFFLLFLKKKKNKFLIVSGILNGISVVFLQQKGLSFFVANIIFLFFCFFAKKIKIKKVLIYLISFFIPLCLFLFWPIKLLFYNLIYFPIFNYAKINQFYNPVYLYMFFLLFFFCFFIFLSKKKKEITIWYLFVVQFFLFLSLLTLPDFYHLIISLFPLGIIITIFLRDKFKEKNKVLKFFLISFLIINIFASSFLAVFVFFNKKDDTLLEVVKNNCQSDYIYVGPFYPQLYFKTRKINACSFDVLFTDHNTVEQFFLAKEQIKEKDPDCGVFYLKNNLKKFNYNKNNSVYNYFKDNYKLIYNKDNVFLYKKYE
jgi:hypothetical protein